jgi:hypothetical protein
VIPLHILDVKYGLVPAQVLVVRAAFRLVAHAFLVDIELDVVLYQRNQFGGILQAA